jgi:hypothetical protein
MRLARFLLAVAALAALGPTACGSPAETELPSALLGIWVTRDRDYADRFLELRSDWVIFGTGGSSISMLPVLDVVAEHGNTGESVYSVGIEEEDGERGTLELRVRGGAHPSLRLGSQSVIWSKRPAAAERGPSEVTS